MKKNTKITIITLITLISIIFISVIIIKNTNKVNANSKSEEEKITINTTEFAEESTTEKSISDNNSDKKNDSDKKTDSNKNDKTKSNKNDSDKTNSNKNDKTDSNKNTSDNSNKTESTTEAKTETTTEAKKPNNNKKPETTTEAKTEATTEKKPNTTEQPFDELDGTMHPIEEPTTHTHSWDSGKVTTQPTCTAAGTKTYTCTSCGATKTESIVAKGHNWTTKTEKVEVAPGYWDEQPVYGYRCHTCGFFTTSNDTIHKHSDDMGHPSFGQASIMEKVWVDPIYDEVTTTYCTVCGKQK